MNRMALSNRHSTFQLLLLIRSKIERQAQYYSEDPLFALNTSFPLIKAFPIRLFYSVDNLT